MIRRFCLAAAVLVGPLSGLLAQEAAPLPPPPATAEVPQAPAMTLEEAVRRALEHNFTLQIEQLTAANAEEALIAARAAFDPILQAEAQRIGSRSPNEGTVVDAEGNIITNTATRYDAATARLRVTQRFSTGTTIGLSGALDRSRNTPSRSRYNPAYDSDITLSVSQSLLRGFGRGYQRAAIEQAEIEVRRAALEFRAAVLDVIRDVEAAYFSLGYAREQLLVQRFSLEVAEQLLEENRARRDTGVSTDLDVLQAEVGVATAARELIEAEQAVNDAADRLLQLIGQTDFQELVGDIRIGEIPPPEISLDRSYQLARLNRPDYTVQEALIEQLRIDARVARRDRLPDVNLDGALGYNAREGTAKAALSDVWEGDGYAWQVGLSVTVPWGSRAERARYRQVLNLLEREQTRLEAIDQDILLRVRSAVRAVETSAEGVRISRLATELSERQFELERARYEAGLSTFRRVQEAQADWDSARVAELQARVSLRAALAELARLEGSALERFNIVLE